MNWTGRERKDDDLERELRAHLDLEAQERCDEGLDPEEARYAARRAFGNPALVKETIREMSKWTVLEQFGQDMRYGARLLRRSPGFSIAAILTLALGIGANTAMFSVVDGVLLRPLPFPEPDRLVRLWEAQPEKGFHLNVVNPLNFMNWRERTRSFESMAALSGWTSNVTGAGEPLAVNGMVVSPEFFSVLRVAPFIGRTFTAEDGIPGRDDGVILSYAFWQSHYGGARRILGKRIMVSGRAATVIGVLPRDFRFPNTKADIWTPLAMDRADAKKEGRHLTTVARLKPGVNLEQARQDLAGVAMQLAAEWPEMDKGWSAEVVPFLQNITANVRLPLLLLLAAVGLVLLIACANVANLLLMRAGGRLREIAVRAALGAGRRRILQQLLSESLLLALAGWTAGVGAGYWGLHGLLAMIPGDTPLPRAESIRLDSGVFLFAFGLSVLTAVVFGLAPAIQISRPELQNALSQGTLRSGVGGNRVFRQALVVTEIALALLLLTSAGLLLRSFARLLAVDPGFRPDHLLTMTMFTSSAKYGGGQKRSQYLDRIIDEIRNVPGVRAAGSVHFLPLTGSVSGSGFTIAPAPPPDSTSPNAEYLVVSRGYFEAIGTPMLSGRDFGAQDRFGSPSVLVVNKSFAERFFPNQDAIGKRLNVAWDIPNPAKIVGVVANARQSELQAAPRPTIFIGNAQAPMYFARLLVRAWLDPRQIVRPVEAAIRRVDPGQAVSDVETMDEVLSDSVARPRFQLELLAVFAAIAVLLALIGVYGVISYSVSQRTQEIGIRVALGACAGDVSRLVLREGLLLTSIGVAAGLVSALMCTRALRSLLFEVTPTDPVTLGSAACLLLAVAVCATLQPAHRASRVDPMIALRYE